MVHTRQDTLTHRGKPFKFPFHKKDKPQNKIPYLKGKYSAMVFTRQTMP